MAHRTDTSASLMPRGAVNGLAAISPQFFGLRVESQARRVEPRVKAERPQASPRTNGLDAGKSRRMLFRPSGRMWVAGLRFRRVGVQRVGQAGSAAVHLFAAFRSMKRFGHSCWAHSLGSIAPGVPGIMQKFELATSCVRSVSARLGQATDLTVTKAEVDEAEELAGRGNPGDVA